MLIKMLKSILVSTFIFIAFANNVLATVVSYSINNKCVIDVYTYSATVARPENGVAVSVVSGYVNIYVLQDSVYSAPVQDVSGKLAQSPNQAFYYDFTPSTLASGVYSGSNSRFVGSTKYLSMASASQISHTTFDASNTTCANGAPQSAVVPETKFTVLASPVGIVGFSPNVTGAGTYVKGSNVTITAPAVSGWVVTSFEGTANGMSFYYPINYSAVSYKYTISNIWTNADIKVRYSKYTEVLTGYKYNLSASTGGTVQVTPVASAIGAGYSSSTFSYYKNDVVKVTALANSGYTFQGWEGGFAGYSSSFDITTYRDVTSKAIFSLNTNTVPMSTATTTVELNVDVFPPGSGLVQHNDYGGSTWTTFFNWTFSSDVNFKIKPVGKNGYKFKGWTSSNIPLSVINALNADLTASYYSLTKLQLANVNAPLLVANFEYDGITPSIVTGYEDSFTEIVASSSLGKFDTLLTSYSVDTGKTLPRSPYIIGGRCVTHVIEFTGNRTISLGLGAYIPSSFNNRYVIYGLEGSALSLEKTGNVFTFKSDPSDFSWSVNSGFGLPAGSYSSDDTSVFAGADNALTFNNVVPMGDPIEYSCTDSTEISTSISPYWVTGFSLMQGISYVSSISASGALINVKFPTSDINGATSTGNPFAYHFGLDLAYTKINCSYGVNASLAYDIGCPAWLSDTDKHDLPLPYDKYKYMWVFSTKPIREFYHQQPIATTSNDIFDVQLSSADKSVLIGSYVADMGTTYNVYATRINLENCRQIFVVSHYSNLNGQIFDAPAKECEEKININTLNGFFANTNVGENSTSTPAIMHYFGIYFTSSGVDFSKFNISTFKQYIRNTVSNPKDLDLKITVTRDADESTPFYVATSTVTIPGYYDAPVYHATTTGYTDIFNATNTIAWIPFASSTQDYTGNRTLTAQNGTSFCTTYMASSSACFDGSNDYVSMSTGFNLSGINWTVEQDVYLTSVSGDRAVIDQSDGSTNAGSSYHFEVSGGYMKLWLMYGSTGTTFSGTYALSANTLYKLRYTYDGSNIRFYVNNSLKDTFSFSQTINNTGTPSIGSLAGSYWFTSGGVRNVYVANIATTTPFPLLTTVYTTIPGYYDAPVYHATTTTTTNGYWDSGLASSTSGTISSATGDNVNGVIKFSNESFSTNFDITLGYSPILSGLDTNINSMYSYTACVDSSTYGLFGYIMCGFISGGMKVFTILIIPSSSALNTFQKMMNERISSGSSLFSTMLSIPLRTSNYGNLLWSPATSTVLTLGLNSSQKVTFLPPNIPAVGSTRYLVDKTLFTWIYPFLQVILLMFSGLWFIRIFKL